LPEFMPGSSKHRVPGKRGFDDDGWTAELGARATRTEGDQQWTGGLRYSILSERGSRGQSPEYSGKRVDLGEITLQKNERSTGPDGTQTYLGVGGGLQMVGNLGGRGVQEWFHKEGGLGGRTGSALQQNYTQDQPTVVPIVTGGWGQLKPTAIQDLHLRTSLSGALALGRGMSSLQGELALQYKPSSRWEVAAGVTASGVYSNHQAMDFIQSNGVRSGAFVESSLQVVPGVKAFARVQNHGVQAEPVYNIGISVGGGDSPWLIPSFR